MTRTLTVMAWPARINARHNSYNLRLSEGVERAGARVIEFSIRDALFGRFDMLHVHWPEGLLKQRGSLMGFVAILVEVALLYWVTLIRRKSLVWTVHNLVPHGGSDSRALRLLHSTLVRIVAGCIYLSTANRDEAFEALPRLRAVPNRVIHIGRYDQEFRPSESIIDTRARYGIPLLSRLVVYAGQIVRYKGALELATVANECDDPQLRVLIVGRAVDDSYGSQIRAMADKNPHVQFHDRWLEAAEMGNLFQAADLVAFPFQSVLNSSSIMPPLEFNTPVLARGLGSLPEMSQIVGTEWLRVFHGPLTPNVLLGSLNSKPMGRPDLARLDWSTIGAQTLAFYLCVNAPQISHRAGAND